MINSILTNMPALKMRNNFNTTSNKLSTSLERLSSGFKINCAKDGAAECVISTKLNNQLSALKTATSNISQGKNMLAQMDSSLDNMLEKVTRIRDLALAASNVAYGEEERLAIQDEIDQLRAEVYREQDTAMYATSKIFEPDKDNEIKPYAYEVEYLESKGNQYISTGVTANKNTKVELKMQCVGPQTSSNFFGARPSGAGSTDAFVITSFSGSKKIGFFHNDKSIPAINYDNEIHTYELGNGVAKIDGVNYGELKNEDFTTQCEMILFGNANGNASNMTTKQRIYSAKIYDGNTLIKDYIPVVDHNGKSALYDKVNKELVYDERGGEFIAGDVVVPPPPTKRTLNLQVGSKAGKYNTVGIELNVTFGVLTGSVLNPEDSQTLSESAKNFTDKLILSKSQIGSVLNRLDSTSNLQANDIVNLSSSKSVITDTDMAKEAANYTQTQILQQVTSSLFSQANLFNSGLALKLLNG